MPFRVMMMREKLLGCLALRRLRRRHARCRHKCRPVCYQCLCHDLWVAQCLALSTYLVPSAQCLHVLCWQGARSVILIMTASAIFLATTLLFQLVLFIHWYIAGCLSSYWLPDQFIQTLLLPAAVQHLHSGPCCCRAVFCFAVSPTASRETPDRI